MNEETFVALLNASLERFARLGIARQTNDIEAYLRYRQGLSPQERDMFEDLIERGTFPGAAAETVEIAAGRLQPHGAAESESPVEVIA